MMLKMLKKVVVGEEGNTNSLNICVKFLSLESWCVVVLAGDNNSLLLGGE